MKDENSTEKKLLIITIAETDITKTMKSNLDGDNLKNIVGTPLQHLRLLSRELQAESIYFLKAEFESLRKSDLWKKGTGKGSKWI